MYLCCPAKDTAKSHFSVTLEGITKEEVAAKSTVSSPPVPSQNDFVGVVSHSLPLAIKNNDKSDVATLPFKEGVCEGDHDHSNQLREQSIQVLSQ